MKNILILGAGTGGSIIANILCKKLPPDQFSITVVDRSNIHYYQPGLLFIPFKLYGYESGDDIRKPVSHVLNQSVNFIQADINLIDYKNNVVQTDKGELEYDWLISSMGCHIEPKEIEGCAEAMGNGVHTFYTLPDALAMQKALEGMNTGHLVINIAELPIKCPVAPIEAAFLADYYFQQRNVRNNIEISLVTPYAGAFTKPNANRVLTNAANEKNIHIIPEFSIQKVDNKAKKIQAYDGKTISYDMLCIIPPTLGPEVLSRSGLANDMNYGLTDHRTLKSKKADNIYFIGDNADLPTSKAGSVSHFESETVVENLLREIEGEKALPSFDGHANCFIESGYHKAYLVDFNYDVEPLPGKFPLPYAGPFSLLEDTHINHLGKMAFKWAYWHLIVNGRLPDMPFVPSHMSLVGKNLKSTAVMHKTQSASVADVMTQNVITISQGSPIHDAVMLLDEQKISGVPVVNPDNEVIGIVTTADLVSALDIDDESPLQKLVAVLLRKGRDKKLGSIVDDIMSKDPVTIRPDESVQSAIELMARCRINRLIVSQDSKKIEGILSRSDLLKVV